MKLRRTLFAALLTLVSACVFDLDSDDDNDERPGGQACGALVGATCRSDEYCDFPDEARCGIADGGGICRSRPSACPLIYAPVIGSDGNEYGNACAAHTEGVDDCGAATE
jgi:hypothetical protein